MTKPLTHIATSDHLRAGVSLVLSTFRKSDVLLWIYPPFVPRACETMARCIDFLYYYPDQMMPDSGGCGLMLCGGGILGMSELAADDDFNRTFGIVDTCTASATEEV